MVSVFGHWVALGPHLVFGIRSLADCLMVNGPCIWSKTMSHASLVPGQVLVLVFGSKVSFPGFCLIQEILGSVCECVCTKCSCISSSSNMGSKVSIPAGSPLGKILGHWQKYSYKPSTKKTLMFCYSAVWPMYTVDSGECSLNYYTICNWNCSVQGLRNRVKFLMYKPLR